MPRARARALITPRRAHWRTATSTWHGDPAEARRALLALPGIGPWTVEYVAMRALRDPDAFLADRPGRAARAGAPRRGRRRPAERWRPYRAYAVVAPVGLTRLIVWRGTDESRQALAEAAAIELFDDGLRATGTQIGADYRVDYELDAHRSRASSPTA